MRLTSGGVAKRPNAGGCNPLPHGSGVRIPPPPPLLLPHSQAVRQRVLVPSCVCSNQTGAAISPRKCVIFYTLFLANI